MKLATTIWRRVRDSNPRSLSTYSISSAAPSTTRTTLRLCDSVQFKKLFARTDGKNNKIFSFRTSPKRSVYGRSKRSILPNLSGISSQSRYDHFDTSPYLSQHQHLGKRGELMGRTSKNIKLKIPEKPRKIKGIPVKELPSSDHDFESSGENRTWRNLKEDNGRCENP